MLSIYKFGGASLNSSGSFEQAAYLLSKYSKTTKILLVVSAMDKMTNAFELLHKSWFSGSYREEYLKKIEHFHFEIIEHLFPKHHIVREEVKSIFDNMISSFLHCSVGTSTDFDKSYDSLIPYGEILSSLILYYYLRQCGFNISLIDATECVFADESWREGKILWKQTEEAIQKKVSPLFESNDIIITQGFIASALSGQWITLGREGSDFSASVFAYCLNSQNVTIWKDVPGLYNADPKNFDNVKLLPHISYQESVELAYYGQSVIHPKTIKPLQNKNIPLYIKYFNEPDAAGSLIDNNTECDTNIPCYIIKKNQMLISVLPKDFTFISECNLEEIFNCLAVNKIHVNMMQNGAISFSFCCDFSKYKLSQVLNCLHEKYYIRYNTDLELITIRNYNDSIIKVLLKERKILLEQRSRVTVQMVVSAC